MAEEVEEVEEGVEGRRLTQTVAEGSSVPGFRVAEVSLRCFAVAKGVCGGCKGLRRFVQKTHQADRMLKAVRNWALSQKMAAVMLILTTKWVLRHRDLHPPPAFSLNGEQLIAENR